MGEHFARRAAQCGFKGIICIVTAASHDEQSRLQQIPYVDAVVGKGFSPAAPTSKLSLHLRSESCGLLSWMLLYQHLARETAHSRGPGIRSWPQRSTLN